MPSSWNVHSHKLDQYPAFPKPENSTKSYSPPRPQHWEENKKVKVNLDYVESLRQIWVHETLIQKKRKNQAREH